MSDELYRDLSPEPENSESVSRGRYIIAVIGIDDYTYWSVLHNAVSDAQGVYKLFVKFHLDERGEMIIRLPNFVSNSALRQPERLSEYIEIEIAEARIRETIAQARIDLGQAQMDQLRLLKLQLAQPYLSLPPAQTSIKSLIDKYYEDAQKGIRS